MRIVPYIPCLGNRARPDPPRKPGKGCCRDGAKPSRGLGFAFTGDKG
jgi:hypothetical protein